MSLLTQFINLISLFFVHIFIIIILTIKISQISLNAGQIMLVHYIFCESATLFSARALSFSLSVWWKRQEKRKAERAGAWAQFESLSATGFSFPLPLLSVCFVSSFVLLCLDSERVHAARHVIALLFKLLSLGIRAFSPHSSCILYKMCTATARGIIPVRQHIYVEYRALGCYQWGPVCVWGQTRSWLFCCSVQARRGNCGWSC